MKILAVLALWGACFLSACQRYKYVASNQDLVVFQDSWNGKLYSVAQKSDQTGLYLEEISAP